ncbi:MAG: hypothetical protein WBN77_15405, partial [Desulfobacterales bacterium]
GNSGPFEKDFVRKKNLNPEKISETFGSLIFMKISLDMGSTIIFRLLSCIWVWVCMLTAENLLKGFDDAPKFYNIVFTGGYDKGLRESKLFRGC